MFRGLLGEDFEYRTFRVFESDLPADPAGFERLLAGRLSRSQLSVIVARRPCILAAADIRNYEKAAAAAGCAACPEVENV